MQRRVDRPGEEAVVLEPAQQPQISRRRRHHDAMVVPARDRDGSRLVDHRDGGQQQREANVGVAVEDVRRGQDERLPQSGVRHQQP